MKKSIINFPNKNVKEFRKECCFKNKAVQVIGEDGEFKNYPCIVLYEEKTNIPIFYTGFERYLCNVTQSELLDSKTLSSKAYAVCHLLNYLLKETDINLINECTLNEIRGFLLSMKIKSDKSEYKKDTWLRYKDYVVDFLELYYKANKEALPFQYRGEELKVLTIIKDEKNRKKVTFIENAFLHVAPPKTTHKKNRFLVEGYLDLLLFEAKKHDPEIALGIALGAYAGLREGEVVNLNCSRIKKIIGGFGIVTGIEIDLTDKAPHFQKWSKKRDSGSIKKYRIQKVYNDFIVKVEKLYDEHIALMESKRIDVSENAPLFVNMYGNPMTVQSYSNRLKKLFNERFLPSLEITCKSQGTYAENAAFIEAYKSEYPGAHMLRHWFTMYLLTQAKLTSGEIMRWRGDSNQNSMNDYIHENEDLIQLYRETSYAFQKQILEDMNL